MKKHVQALKNILPAAVISGLAWTYREEFPGVPAVSQLEANLRLKAPIFATSPVLGLIDGIAILGSTALLLWGIRCSRTPRELIQNSTLSLTVALGSWLLAALSGMPLSWEALLIACSANLLLSGLTHSTPVPVAHKKATPESLPPQPAITAPSAQTPPPSIPEPRIIVATILHAQLVNLAELLESEDAAACDKLVQSAIREVISACRRFGGTIQSLSINSVQAVFQHDTSGSHASQALRAGILARERLNTLANPIKNGSPRCLPDFRFGINTGETLSTVLTTPAQTPSIGGEPVEWARKLSSANLLFGSKVLAGPSTLSLASPSFECRTLDTLQRFLPPFPPENVVEPIALKGTLDPDEKQRLDAWEDGIRLFRNQRWLAARNHLLRSIPQNETDAALDLYLARIEEKLSPQAPPDEPDGIRPLPQLANSRKAS